MIVCLCMGSSESEIKECISQGASSIEMIEEACGAGSCCQSCHAEILSLLAADHACAMGPPSGAYHEEKKVPGYRSIERSLNSRINRD